MEVATRFPSAKRKELLTQSPVSSENILSE